MNCLPFLQYGPHDDSVRESSIRSLVDSLASKMHASFDLISLVLPRVTSMQLHFLLDFAKHSKARAIGVSNFLRASLMVSSNSLSSRSSEINSCVICLALSKFRLSHRDHFCLSFSLAFLTNFRPEFWP